MHSYKQWCCKAFVTTAVCCAVVSAAAAQVPFGMRTGQSFMPGDEAREIFNLGQKFYDEYRFADAETKFREVVQRSSKNPIADRADYYLIRTLTQTGKKNEALSRIVSFPRRYPSSKWLNDVQELRMQLTNEVPARADEILLYGSAPVPEQTPAVRPTRVYRAVPLPPSTFPAPAPAPPAGQPAVAAPFVFTFQPSNPEISLQQEIMRAMFHVNVDRAIEIATERLKANPADPVVLSSLNLVAASPSPQSTSMLVTIAKNSVNPKARRDAIFWLGQSRANRDAVVDTLVGLLPTIADDDSEAVVYSLSQIRTDKSMGALATIARDRAKSEKVRNDAVRSIGQSRVANRVGWLEDVYKNCMDNSRVRQQALLALSQVREPRALTLIGNIASSDPDIELRRRAAAVLSQTGSSDPNVNFQRVLQTR